MVGNLRIGPQTADRRPRTADRGTIPINAET